MYIYIYVYVFMYICIYIYIYEKFNAAVDAVCCTADAVLC